MHICKSQGSYLLVEITEPLSIMPVAFQDMANVCRQENLDKILVDMLAIHTTISTFDRYRAGVYIASIIGWRIKVAVVAQVTLITHMTETVAVNRYSKLKVFSEMEPALAWLGVGT